MKTVFFPTTLLEILVNNQFFQTAHLFRAPICFGFLHSNSLRMSGIQHMDYSKFTDTDWRKKLSEEEFYVCRESGTEAVSRICILFTIEYFKTISMIYVSAFQERVL